eukprot:m.24641 g.24641  ORF g.24641 m.24641 type:complete len:805 (-) comp7565_c0_seq1:275-2689(-)
MREPVATLWWCTYLMGVAWTLQHVVSGDGVSYYGKVFNSSFMPWQWSWSSPIMYLLMQACTRAVVFPFVVLHPLRNLKSTSVDRVALATLAVARQASSVVASGAQDQDSAAGGPALDTPFHKRAMSISVMPKSVFNPKTFSSRSLDLQAVAKPRPVVAPMAHSVSDSEAPFAKATGGAAQQQLRQRQQQQRRTLGPSLVQHRRHPSSLGDQPQQPSSGDEAAELETIISGRPSPMPDQGSTPPSTPLTRSASVDNLASSSTTGASMADSGLRADDLCLFWVLSLSLTTLWPRTYKLVRQGSAASHFCRNMMMWARCFPGTIIVILVVLKRREFDVSLWITALRVVSQFWCVYHGIRVGQSYFSHEVDIWCQTGPEDYFWRKLRSCNLSGTALWSVQPRRLQEWAKVCLVVLLLSCALEAEARRVLALLRHGDVSIDPEWDAHIGIDELDGWGDTLVVTELWRDVIVLPYKLVTQFPIFVVLMVLGTGLIGGAAVLGKLDFTSPRFVIAHKAISWALLLAAKLLEGLCAFFILVTMRRFTIALLSLVICVDLHGFEDRIRKFAAKLLQYSPAARAARYVQLGESLRSLNKRLHPVIAFIVFDQVVNLIMDVCGGEDGSCFEAWCTSSDDPSRCVGPVSVEYAWQTVAYVCRHGVPFSLMFLVLWRMSSLNHSYHEGVVEAMATARFASIADDELTDVDVSKLLAGTVHHDDSTASEVPLMTSRAPTPRGCTTHKVEHQELLAWSSFSQLRYRKNYVGVTLFGWVVGRIQLLAWLGAVALSLFAEQSQRWVSMFPVLDIIRRMFFG